jgi:hypothetical protein
MIITPRTHWKHFTWTKNLELQKTIGVAEASTLGFRAGKIPGGRIYDDACDFGFVVEGRVKDVIFTYSHYHNDAWKYVSTCGKFALHILND